jgi:dTMP kinase
MIKNDISYLTKHFEAVQYNNSFLLSFEGIEGSGKSTQIKLLTERLQDSNYQVTYFREPGGTAFGEKLRTAILESKSAIDPLAEANLFAASRAQLLFEKVIPVMAQTNQVIILDRYIDSSIAYQGIARDLGIETILDLHKRAPLNTTCHCTFYLKIDVETSLERQEIRGNEKDYFEKENKAFYTKLISGFDQSALLFPKRISIIDGTKEQELIHNNILKQLIEKTGISL